MECSRCGGFMVQEEFFGLQEEAFPVTSLGWRCVMCGEVVDSVIAANRGIAAGRTNKARHPALSHSS